MVKLTKNMEIVLKELNKVGGSAFARELKIEGSTFNSINATLSALAGEKYGLVKKSKEFVQELGKIYTKYTITESGLENLIKE